MTRTGYSHITLVCDRSGSMAPIRTDAEGAVNTFIADQRTVPGTATLLLVEFDFSHDDGYHIVHDGDILTCRTYHLQPRGNTALLDAVGRAITDTGAKLDALPEDAKPEHVIFVVQTDGQENASVDWTLEAVRDLIKRQTDEWNWQFVFLGMGPDTFAQGQAMGFQNVTRSAQAPDAYVATYSNTSDNVRGLRTNSVADLAGTNVDVDEHGNVRQS